MNVVGANVPGYGIVCPEDGINEEKVPECTVALSAAIGEKCRFDDPPYTVHAIHRNVETCGVVVPSIIVGNDGERDKKVGDLDSVDGIAGAYDSGLKGLRPNNGIEEGKKGKWEGDVVVIVAFGGRSLFFLVRAHG